MAAIDEQMGGDHYRKMAIQPIQFITANNIPYCEANAIKYLCRWRAKGGVDDLKKAKHYIDLLIESQLVTAHIPKVDLRSSVDGGLDLAPGKLIDMRCM